MAIRIIRFWTKYPKRNGEIVAEDWVEFCAPGRGATATTPAPISALSRVIENHDPQNTAAQMAHDRWNGIKPAYEAWKAGREIPTHGTPLAVWPGVTQEQADVIKTFGIRSVDELAGSPDSVLTRIQLPGIRVLQEQAKAFLLAKDQSRVADAISAKDGEIASLRDQLEELRQLVIAQSAQSQTPDADDEAPRKRGRPPKVQPHADEVVA